jgi:hypothetical protein
LRKHPCAQLERGGPSIWETWRTKKQPKTLKQRAQNKAIRSQQQAVSLIHPMLRHLNQARN